MRPRQHIFETRQFTVLVCLLHKVRWTQTCCRFAVREELQCGASVLILCTMLTRQPNPPVWWVHSIPSRTLPPDVARGSHQLQSPLHPFPIVIMTILSYAFLECRILDMCHRTCTSRATIALLRVSDLSDLRLPASWIDRHTDFAIPERSLLVSLIYLLTSVLFSRAHRERCIFT